MFKLTLVTTVYINPNKAINANKATNLYESFSNLKSTGGGYKMLRTNPPEKDNFVKNNLKILTRVD